MATIDIRIDDAEVRHVLDQLVRSAANLRPAMRAIAGLLHDQAEQAFADERDPATGKPWAALKPSTIRERTIAGKWPGKILQRSAGGLAAEISSDHGDDFAVAGTNKDYGAIHQFGGQAGRGGASNIPARPFLGLSPSGRDELLDILSTHLLNNI